jgi:Family of unknown function (DUF5995)
MLSFMPNLSPLDQQLLALVSATPLPSTISDFITLLTEIDNLLPLNDGLKWFNKLYLQVTQAIDQQPSANWSDPTWVTGLDVVFAGFYVTAIAEFLNNDPATPSAWDAILESRTKPNLERIQFALAGMNAHINHDLALALVKTNNQMNLQPTLQSPEHTDYQRVNNLLSQLLPNALTDLATGLLGGLAEDAGKVGQLLAIWDVATARDLAWTFASHLESVPQTAWPGALAIQNKLTGLAGRALLQPLG